MCTAITFNGYFGRTLDYEVGFGEEAVSLPTGYTLEMRHRGKIKLETPIVGMARMESEYPLFFDAMNGNGIGMAGLNFVGHAHYTKGKKGDIAPFELIPYILSQARSLDDVTALLEGVSIADTPFSPSLPNAQLHWAVSDGEQSLVIESTKEGLDIFTAPTGVLTNAPDYPFQLTNLATYMGLSAKPIGNTFSPSLELIPFSRGMGAIGLPGDWSSTSRFVRASFVRENAIREKSVEHFFKLMATVSVPKGCMVLENGDLEYTRYTSCMDLAEGKYYWSEYDKEREVKVMVNDE